jgi:hypothetical protein
MNKSRKLHLIVPVLNELENLPTLFDTFRKVEGKFSLYLHSATRKGKSKMKRLKTVIGYFKLWAQEQRWMRGLTVRCARPPIRFLQSSPTLDPL